VPKTLKPPYGGFNVLGTLLSENAMFDQIVGNDLEQCSALGYLSPENFELKNSA
jgi:hypothetical protein